MRNRRTFVPENPAGLSLEERLAPSSISGWFDHTYRQIRDKIAPHHHNQNAAAGIQQLWNNSAKLSQPHQDPAFHPGSAPHPGHHHHQVK